MQNMNFDIRDFKGHSLFHKIYFEYNFKLFFYKIMWIESIYLHVHCIIKRIYYYLVC